RGKQAELTHRSPPFRNEMCDVAKCPAQRLGPKPAPGRDDALLGPIEDRVARDVEQIGELPGVVETPGKGRRRRALESMTGHGENPLSLVWMGNRTRRGTSCPRLQA